MDNKVFVIFSSGAEILSDAIKSCSCKTEVVEINPRLTNVFVRALRFLSLKYNLFKGVWFYYELLKFHVKKKNYPANTDFIAIVFDVPIWILNIHLFKKFFPIKNIKFWFWNPLDNFRKQNIDLISNNVDVLASFDQNNCKDFKLQFISQFYWNSFNEIKNEEIYDVVYVGRSKNRLTQIEEFYKHCSKLGLNVLFHVKKDFKSQTSNVLDLKEENLHYRSYLELIQQSRAIVEFNSLEQAGLTLRPLEAMFYGKKLITNNTEIKSYDFYSIENIFVMDQGNELKKDFFEMKVQPYAESLKYEYSFENWIYKISSL